MKKIKIGLPILAFVLAIAASAFTALPDNETLQASPQTVLHWFTDPTNASSYTRDNTVPMEQDVTGCEDLEGDVCEYGFTDSQLNISGDPSSGVKLSEQNNGTEIYRID